MCKLERLLLNTGFHPSIIFVLETGAYLKELHSQILDKRSSLLGYGVNYKIVVVQVPGSKIVVKFDENDDEMTVSFGKFVGFIVLLWECPMTTTASEKSY